MLKSRTKKKPPKHVLALPDPEQAKCAVLNTLTSKSGQRTYDLRSLNSWSGTARNHVWPSTALWSSDTESPSNRNSTRPRRSICVLRLSGELLMKRPTLACSARNWPRAFAASKECAGWASVLGIG